MMAVFVQLTVYATGERIPDCLLMDLRGLKGGDKIMASHVELNDGLRLVSGGPVCPCASPL